MYVARGLYYIYVHDTWVVGISQMHVLCTLGFTINSLIEQSRSYHDGNFVIALLENLL